MLDRCVQLERRAHYAQSRSQQHRDDREPRSASSKSGPVSFLDILMNGVGVGVQAADASGAQKQSSSQANPSDPSTTEEETSATGSSEAAMGASTSTESWLTKDEDALTGLSFRRDGAASTQPATPLGKNFRHHAERSRQIVRDLFEPTGKRHPGGTDRDGSDPRSGGTTSDFDRGNKLTAGTR